MVSGGKKYSFFEKFGVLCFLETPVLRFSLLRYCQGFYHWLDNVIDELHGCLVSWMFGCLVSWMFGFFLVLIRIMEEKR